MNTFIYHSWDYDKKIPDQHKKHIEEPYSKYDFYSWLVVEWDDGSVEVYDDKMEPEDAMFNRDLNWIISLVQKAYAKGKEAKEQS
jgi:hypothetical protein